MNKTKKISEGRIQKVARGIQKKIGKCCLGTHSYYRGCYTNFYMELLSVLRG
jgi:hypothetical protein